MQGRRGADTRGQHARLPPVHIAPASSTSLIPQSSNLIQNPPEPRRNRLPPRSRSGCWTCRTRKVKCDEKRPACGQCFRLGHNCDYNPRLSFKDDTPRIVGRMQDVSAFGSSVWDPNVANTSSQRSGSVEDLLPPFSALTTDEERERKAELQEPGTYHVIANPSSFSAMPEYEDDSQGQRDSYSMPQKALFFGGMENTGLSKTDRDKQDPNTIILTVFEEPNRRVMPFFRTTDSAPPGSFPISLSQTIGISSHSGHHSPANQQFSMLDIARSGGRDAHLLQHYRSAISVHVFREAAIFRHFLSDSDLDTTGSEDIFEMQARIFPPLFHAMMALAALSVAYKNRLHNADALEHYQQVIPALQAAVQSSQDSYSDGALFTHFILLLYEIAAADHRDSNMWEHHINQLLRILTLRRQQNGIEPHALVTWTIYSIDVYALLCSVGTGNFAEALLRTNMLPLPDTALIHDFSKQQSKVPPRLEHSTSSGESSDTPALSIFDLNLEEYDYFPAIIHFNHEILLLAVRVGQIARDFRIEASERQSGFSAEMLPEPIYLMGRQDRVQSLRSLISQSQSKWREKYPNAWSLTESLPPRAFSWTAHAYMLLRACIIYANTSMFAGQLSEQTISSASVVSTCATEILLVARMIVSQERFDLRCIVFALFMAGFATRDTEEKATTLKLIRDLELHSLGATTKTIRTLLEEVYVKQRAANSLAGNANSVDWVEEMELSGQRLVIYGL